MTAGRDRLWQTQLSTLSQWTEQQAAGCSTLSLDLQTNAFKSHALPYSHARL
jgi:hypothetical protein